MLNHNYVGVCLCLPLSACVLEFLLGCVCVCVFVHIPVARLCTSGMFPVECAGVQSLCVHPCVFVVSMRTGESPAPSTAITHTGRCWRSLRLVPL